MPEFIDGLPLHALVVHFVVVMLPLSVLGAVVIAVWPAARRRFGWLVVAAAGASALAVPIAANSGKELANRIPRDDLIARHEELGESLVWWAVPLFIVVLGLMVLHTKMQQPATVITVVAAVVTIGIAVGTGVMTYRVGDAGARSVWGDVENIPRAQRLGTEAGHQPARDAALQHDLAGSVGVEPHVRQLPARELRVDGQLRGRRAPGHPGRYAQRPVLPVPVDHPVGTAHTAIT